MAASALWDRYLCICLFICLFIYLLQADNVKWPIIVEIPVASLLQLLLYFFAGVTAILLVLL